MMLENGKSSAANLNIIRSEKWRHGFEMVDGRQSYYGNDS